ncbi:MAG: MFS transporter [Humidesulfovibrio sp.]|nr:MFS transporter [Humidesulfovibrio sp.]
MTSAAGMEEKGQERGFRQKLCAMLGLCFVLIMVALDQTVIGTALPTIVAELHGFDLYAWVGTSYLLTSVIAVPIIGKLGDDYGRKPFVLAAITLFTLASALCGAAQSMHQLVLARALQGVGGGMLVASAFASVPDLFPGAYERLRWQVLFSSAFGLANVVGPSLGGYLAQYWGWRWVFLVNLPVGVLSLGFIWRYLPRIRHSEQPPSRLDWLGSLLVTLTLGSIQLLVEWLPMHKPALLLLTLGLTGAVSGVVLVWWERRCANPVLPLSMITHRGLAPLFALSMAMGFGMFAVMYFAPLLFQGGFGFSSNQSGLLITPLAVFITIGSIVNGRIVTRLSRPNSMLYLGLCFFWAATIALTQTTAATPRGMIAGAMMLGGIGLGLLLPNITLFVQAIAHRTQLGVATAMLQSMRMVGGMLGMALCGSYISSSYVHGVNSMLAANGASQWSSWLDDPQILVNHALAEKFNAAMAQVGGGAGLLVEARNAMVSAIHGSQWIVVVLLALALWITRLVPPVNLHSEATLQEPSHE